VVFSFRTKKKWAWRAEIREEEVRAKNKTIKQQNKYELPPYREKD
jgi:hypothetical protein